MKYFIIEGETVLIRCRVSFRKVSSYSKDLNLARIIVLCQINYKICYMKLT
jgi:hypothetical protein